MKVGIILPGTINMCPYIDYYTDVLDSYGIEYEFICWDRYGEESFNNKNIKIHNFKLKSPYTNNFISKLFDYWSYSKYVEKCLNNNVYNLLIVHTIVNGIFLKKHLYGNFKNKYIFDIRDYSPIYPFLKKTIKKIITNSFSTVISSIGFSRWLPENFDYIIGHNTKKSNLTFALKKEEVLQFQNKTLNILTIGQIRHFDTNVWILDSMGNKENISLIFAGWGFAVSKLEEYSKKFSNVVFTGKYKKENEGSIVELSDFLNIILPSTLLETTLISNRFYLSLVYRKPMIVNCESIQANYVRKFNLGIVLNPTDNIYEKIQTYIIEFDRNEFEKGCLEMLKQIRNDIDVFENKIISFISQKID